MKMNKSRILALLLALVLCASAMTLPAFAEPDETTAHAETNPAETTPVETTPAETTPVETTPVETAVPVETEAPVETEPVAPTEPETEPPTEEPTEPEPVATEEPEPEPRSMLRFTQDGNLTLIDDFQYVGMDENGNILSKQFIVIQDRSGNYFYIIIDRIGETENVYFLNQVDLADLKALASSANQAAVTATCTCSTKCTAGHVDTTCPICSVNMSECEGAEAKPVQTDPEPTTTSDPEQPAEPASKTSVNPILVIVLVAAMAGIAIFYFIKNKSKGKKNKSSSDFDFDEEDEEYEAEPADESPEDDD